MKIYLEEAVDALNEADVRILFPDDRRPDLYTVAHELVGMRGEVKRLSQSSLKIANEVQAMMGAFREARAEAEKAVQPDVVEEQLIDPDLQTLLKGIIEQDAIQQRTIESLKKLPSPNWKHFFRFREQFAAWRQGYTIGYKQWQQLMKSIGLKQTGLVGTSFDPIYHEAIDTQSVPDKADSIILETELIGYIYKQKIVQPAKVVVNKIST
ncbi:MAG: nucleotide exchange factor GrpE [Bacteroidota bacterium]